MTSVFYLIVFLQSSMYPHVLAFNDIQAACSKLNELEESQQARIYKGISESTNRFSESDTIVTEGKCQAKQEFVFK